ncbi:MAG: cytochrome c biogenesis protein CcsA [Thermodesulfovibrionales bacterium]|nr:cytochrome c biogenesis protein CcsA [Thermodesulfovibrionales bacterium]
MDNFYAVYIGMHWVAVFFYILASVSNIAGVIFNKQKAEKSGYLILAIGLLIHGAAILAGWIKAGHGPYISAHEALSSFSWCTLVLFLFFIRLYPRLKPASVIIFPAGFLMVALAMFFEPNIYTLPPTFRSVWLIFHISFYKISLATIVVAMACSVFYLHKKRSSSDWLSRIPDLDTLDLFAYRFAGFSFIFWGTGMLAGSIWAYQSWGRFWGWDPVESWSFITWVAFGAYLHLRRFFGWKGNRAAWFYIGVFILSLVSLFYLSHLSTSLHIEFLRP